MKSPDQIAAWEVRSLNHPAVVVHAHNWLEAFGLAMAEMGQDHELSRLACERLPNGQFLVNDLGRRERYTVLPSTD
ncbi:MAG: hypothetical protein AAFV53_20420 [Myxococcota bacterium]